MVLLHTSELPPPGRWEEFEDLCLDLWKKRWSDIDAKKHGRTGQKQHGVDVYGTNTQTGLIEGVQCKKYRGIPTVKSLRAEVNKAKKFAPAITRFYFAYTKLSDQKLQEEARKINEQHQASGLFTVDVYSWDDIKLELAKYPDVARQHYPDWNPTNQILDKALSVHERLSNPQIIFNQIKQLTKVYKPVTALAILEKLRLDIWDTAGPEIKYLILKHTGVAELQLEKFAESGTAFIAALQYKRDDTEAMSTAATGYLLTENHQEATKLAKEVIKLDPTNAEAYMVLVGSAPADGLLAVINSIPAEQQNSYKVARAIAVRLFQQGDIMQGMAWLRKALENNTDDVPQVIGHLATVILDKLVTDVPEIGVNSLANEEIRKKLEEVIDLFSQAWSKISQSEIKPLKISWLVNRSTAKKLLGNLEDALQDIEEAILIVGEDEDLLLKKAAILSENNDHRAAIKCLRKVQSLSEARIVLAVELTYMKEYPEAEKILLDLSSLIDDQDPIKQKLYRALAEVYIELEKYPEAEAELQKLIALAPNNGLYDILWLRLQIKKVGLTEAKELLTKINKNDLNPAEALLLADTLYESELFEDAKGLYEGVLLNTTVIKDTIWINRLISSYYECGELGDALKLCKALRQQYGIAKYGTKVEAGIYDRTGNIPGAMKTYEEYLIKYPDDFEVQLRYQGLMLRTGRMDVVGNFLDLHRTIDLSKIPLDQGLFFADLFFKSGKMHEAVDIIYILRRRYYSQEDAHGNYCTMFLRYIKDEDEFFTPENVVVNSAITLKYEDGAERLYIIESSRDCDLAKGEVSADHPIAQKLMGHKKGDKVVMNSNKYSQITAEITGIKSKYVHALHESMEDFNVNFPMATGLLKVPVESSVTQEGIPQNLDKLLQAINDHHVSFEKMLHLYDEGKITIAGLSILIQRNISDTLAILGNTATGILVSKDLPQEYGNALQALNKKPKIIIDLLTLITIHNLDIKTVLIEAFGKFYIAQSTKDEVLEMIEERKSQLKGFTVIGIDAGRRVSQKITPEQVKSSLDYFEKILQWMEANCIVRPINASLSVNQKDKAKWEELLGRSSVDSILLSSEAGNILYTDDDKLRDIAWADFSVSGTWTQALLIHLKDVLKIIDVNAYYSVLLKLITSNFKYIYFDGDFLFYVARLSGWGSKETFDVLLRKLKARNLDADIVADFILKLWNETEIALTDLKKNALMSQALEAMISVGNKRTKIRQLKNHINDLFRLSPVQEHQILSIVRVWAQSKNLL